MLVLSRKSGEEIVIAGGIRVTVVSVRGQVVRLGIEAPPGVRIDRLEVHERRTPDGADRPAGVPVRA
jgi:carbon storage regulator